MFGIGFLELVVIAVVALVFVGPKKLPEFMKQAGKFFVQVRRTATDVRSTFDQVVRDAEDELRREETRQLQRQLHAAQNPNATVPHGGDDLHNSDGTLKSTGAMPDDPHHHAHEVAPVVGVEAAATAATAATAHSPDGAKPFDPGSAQPGAPASVTDAQWRDVPPVAPSDAAPTPAPASGNKN